MEGIFGTIVSISWIIGIIGLWMIFQDNGEAAWKALIPFYSTYIFSRTFFEERLGKKLAWSQLVLFILSIPFIALAMLVIFLVITLALGSSVGILGEEDFWAQLFGPSSEPIFFILIILFLVFIIVGIFVVINHIKLHHRYNLFKNAPSWMMLVWILFPGFGYFYYGLQHETSFDSWNDNI